MAEKRKIVTITFTGDAQVKDHNGEIECDFKAGQVVKTNEASARRWMKRGLAVEGLIKAVKPAETAEGDKADDAGNDNATS